MILLENFRELGPELRNELLLEISIREAATERVMQILIRYFNEIAPDLRDQIFYNIAIQVAKLTVWGAEYLPVELRDLLLKLYRKEAQTNKEKSSYKIMPSITA